MSGRAPSLSIEITRECPLACPGCYAYNDEHLNNGLTLREVRDFRGQQLVDGVLEIVRKHKPLHLSIVGGDPLVRLFELEELLPKLTAMGVHCQIVTSAFRKIPSHWAENPFISTVGWVLPVLVSGDVIVSSVLSLPTAGPILIQALKTQDMYLGGALIMFQCVLVLIGTLISDLLLVWIDPRIRYDD